MIDSVARALAAAALRKVDSGSIDDIIKDNVISSDSTYSSEKIERLLNDAGVNPVEVGEGLVKDNNIISVDLDAENTNGLTLTVDGLGLGIATESFAGAMSAVDKQTLNSMAEDIEALKECFIWGEM